MTVQCFSGGAGYGKTYQLMRALSELLSDRPLQNGQKVLALTFMHGSRRRLDERLKSVSGLGNRFECNTVDSFAWRIVRRWQSLASQLGFNPPTPENFELTCEAAAAILEHDIVVRWVAATFPILLLDEAQDLDPVRLSLVRSLATGVNILAAADEFQCLKEELRPNPACEWFAASSSIIELDTPHRTNVQSLLDAANAIRAGAPPVSNKLFQIQLTPNPQLAGSWLANARGWYGGGLSVAIITLTAGQFAQEVVEWVRTNTTLQKKGPYPVYWEVSEVKAADGFLNQLSMASHCNSADIQAAIDICGNIRISKEVAGWFDLQRRTQGKETFSRAEIEALVRQLFSNRRRGNPDSGRGVRAMTIHGAKNREFDFVIVLWPAAIGGSDDQKRRLLYNAVTRAKQRCLILVQAQNSLKRAPFI